jgi:hypothetical protein
MAVEIRIGDSRALLKDMPDESAHLSSPASRQAAPLVAPCWIRSAVRERPDWWPTDLAATPCCWS